MVDLTTLSPQDVQLLREMIRWWRAQAPYRQQRGVSTNKPQMLGSYIAEVTTEISAGNWPTPGTGAVIFYKLNDAKSNIESWSDPTTVYNFTTVAATVGQHVALDQDPFGDYWLKTGDCS